MPFSVGRIYVEKRFSEDSKKAVSLLQAKYWISSQGKLKKLSFFYQIKAIEMVQNIRLQFKSILSQVSWMDDPSKTTAQDKVYSQIFIEVYIFL
jgi:predicted metalloendopeptidase